MSAIAIVGMGCRFAGSTDLHDYWKLTVDGRDAFGPVPADRWPESAFYDENPRSADKTYAKAGAFIDDIRSFPALMLGIPPRRVEVMDPQQRLSIEVALQAIADAGYLPSALPRRTGVYVGITANEFRMMMGTRVMATMMATGQLGRAPEDAEALADAVERIVQVRPFTAPGVLANMPSAAVAQELDLKGPAYTVDAACASALVAVHAAVSQLRAGTIDAALAGGSYLQITPEHYIAFARIGAMSAQGRCLPFDTRADGFVQGEGAGSFLLKRLEDAERDGDRIYAVIEGIALNNDGHGDGPMAPVRAGQAAVMVDAWKDSGLDPADVRYIETHGTGTSVGDVSEIGAMRDALEGRTKGTWLGSSKANVGHTMSAAAAAGLARTVLAVHRGVVPPLAGFETPKEAIEIERGDFAFPTTAQAWDGPRIAALSSFGFGGTNGHLVLRGYDGASSSVSAAVSTSGAGAVAPNVDAGPERLEIVRFSAGTTEGLKRTAARIADEVRRDAALTPAQVARTWNVRQAVDHRCALVVGSREDLLAQLDEVADGGFPKGANIGEIPVVPPKVAVLFAGQGAQRVGMLRSVLERFPVVAEAIEGFEGDLDGLLPRPLTHLLYPERRSEPVELDVAEAELTQTENCQPALVAAGLALYRILEDVGVSPTAATGHSLGEFAAASVGGVLSPRDAVRFAAFRGAAMNAVDGDPGTMAALRCSADKAGTFLVAGAVIANDNHPKQVVVSGQTDAVAQVIERASAAGVDAKALTVSHAFHSPVFDQVDGEALVAQVELHDPRPDVVVASGIADAPYASAADAHAVFARHQRSPVKFQRALQQCAEAGATIYLQVGAGGPLASFARKVVGRDAQAVLSLSGREDDDGGRAVLEALGRLWVEGVDLDTTSLTTDTPVASLPAQEWPREAYWPVKDRAQRRLSMQAAHRSAEASGAPVEEAVVEVPTNGAGHVAVSDDGEVTREQVFDRVADVVAKVSSYPRAAVRPELSLFDDLGFDSLMVSDLATGLTEAFPGFGGLPRELLLNRPTVDAVARYVHEHREAAVFDDDEALLSYAPVWRPAPPAQTRRASLEGLRVAVAGAVDPLLTGALRIAKATVVEDPSEAVDVLLYAGDFGDPVPVEAVLAGHAERPDPAANLIARLDTYAKRGESPGVLLLARVDDPWAHGLAGVVRSASQEWSGRQYQTLWFSGMPSAERAAAAVLALQGDDRTPETLMTPDGRFYGGFEVVEAPLEGWTPTAKDRVLVTGGTRGIGRALAQRLAAAGADVVVVGRRAPDEPLGERISAVAADVTDRAALIEAVELHRPFTAVVHSAGVLADGALGSVEQERGQMARRIKIDGLLNALAAAGDKVHVAMTLGSWAGRFGNRHQAHYAAANATVAGIAELAKGDVRFVTGEYGPWSTSEMVATIPTAIQATMRAEGIDFVGDEAGMEALLADLHHGTGARVKGRRLPYWLRRRSVEHRFATETHPYLVDHAIEGVPVLPLAAAADLLAEVAGVPAPFEVTDLRLFTGITVAEPVTVLASVDGDKAELRLGPQRTLAYQARVRPAAPFEDPDLLSGGESPKTDLATFYADVTFHGPQLQGLTRVDGVSDTFARGVVTSRTPADWIPSTDRSSWSIDPLAVDSAFQLGALVVWDTYGRAGTPVAVRRIIQVQPAVPGDLTVEARFDEAEGDKFTASFWLRDDLGTLVTVIEGTVAEMQADPAEAESEAPTNGAGAPFVPKPEQVDPALWPEIRDLEQRLEMALAVGLENPYFHVHEGTARDTTVVEGKELVNFSSYNYLGLSGDPRVLEQVNAAVVKYGTSVSASRVASGERPFHQELERELAEAQGLEDSLVFSAGHMTNVNVIGHLMKPGDLILHDELIHDSALQGIKLSGAGRRPFRHEDPEHLDQLLEELRPHYDKCLIIAEGVYSMDGDITNYPAWVELKRKHGCLLMIDEAHSFGVCGPTGCGVGEHFKGDVSPRDADLWMGTLSKSLASCGGWIAGSETIIRYLRYTAPGFVYSAGITPANAVAALASLRLMLEEPWRVEKLQGNAKVFHDALVAHGIDTGPALGGSGVVPAITGHSMHALYLSQRLKQQGINVQPIVYPAVADDAARLRFFLSSTHSHEQLRWTAECVATTLAGIREEFPAGPTNPTPAPSGDSSAHA